MYVSVTVSQRQSNKRAGWRAGARASERERAGGKAGGAGGKAGRREEGREGGRGRLLLVGCLLCVRASWPRPPWPAALGVLSHSALGMLVCLSAFPVERQAGSPSFSWAQACRSSSMGQRRGDSTAALCAALPVLSSWRCGISNQHKVA